MTKILIVEDEYITAKNLRNSLEKMGYEICGAVASGEEAITCADKERPDLVLMDIRLSGDLDGIGAAGQIREQFNIPCVYTTAFADKQTIERAKTTEPFGYILKPFSDKDIHSNIEIALYKHQAESRFRRALSGTIHALGSLVRLHDPYIDEQHEKAAALGAAIAEEMGLDKQTIEGTRTAGLLHALGLISLPYELLNRRSHMTDTEQEIFQGYPERSYEIIKNIDFPWPVAEAVRQHRERMDGSGFPAGLPGDAIIPEAQVLGLACYFATRLIGYCCEKPSSEKEILDDLKQDNGKLFNPAVSDACIRLFEQKGFNL